MYKELIGAWCLSNWGGVGVLELNDDSMIIKYYDDEPFEVDIKYEYNENREDYDRNYIIVHGMKLYLDECMRI